MTCKLVIMYYIYDIIIYKIAILVQGDSLLKLAAVHPSTLSLCP